jgi:putative flippase GtrA
MLLYGLQKVGTLWLLAAVQALVSAWMVALLFRAMAPRAAGWSYAVLMALLAGLTTLPYIAGFALPDIFAASVCAAIALLVVYRDTLKRWEQWGVAAILAASLTFHTSHILLAAVAIPAALATAWAMKAPGRELKVSGALLGGALVLGVALTSGYALGIKLTTGDDFGRPPFLTARVIADGPGRDYLRWSCAHGGKWAMCRFRNTPLRDSEEIIWSDKPETGAFNRASYSERVMMARQDMSFALHTLAYDPLGQIGASLKNWGLQLVRVRADEPLLDPSVYLRNPYWSTTDLIPMIKAVGPCTTKGGCVPRFSIIGLEWVHTPFLFLALAVMIWRLARSDVRRAAFKERDLAWERPLARMLLCAAVVVLAVIINAAVCGAFSIPAPRYQARVIWLIPAIAGIMGLSMVTERRWSKLKLRIPQAWLDRLRPLLDRARPVTGLVDPAFIRFGLVGAAGFTIDAIILHGLVHAGMNYFGGRLVSFAIAVVCTWQMNRSFTFRTPSAHGTFKEAALYVGVQCAGGAANIGVYTAAILLMPVLKDWLLVPLAMGSGAGLCLTFIGSKHLAFREREPGLGPVDPAGV